MLVPCDGPPIAPIVAAPPPPPPNAGEVPSGCEKAGGAAPKALREGPLPPAGLLPNTGIGPPAGTAPNAPAPAAAGPPPPPEPKSELPALLLLVFDPNAVDAALPFIGLLPTPPPLPPKMELEAPVPAVLLAPENALVDTAFGPATAPKALALVWAVKPPPPNVVPTGFGGFMFAPCAPAVPCSGVAGAPPQLKTLDGAPFEHPPRAGGAEAEGAGAPPPLVNGPLIEVDAEAAAEDGKALVEGKVLLPSAPGPPPAVLPVLLLPNGVLPFLPPLSGVPIPKAEAVPLPEEPDAGAVDASEETPAAPANAAGDTFGPWA